MLVLAGLSCATRSITGAGTDNCSVTLNAAAAGSGFSVSLASNNTSVIVPATVTVAAGATGANFTATVSSVSTAATVTLTASAGSVTRDLRSAAWCNRTDAGRQLHEPDVWKCECEHSHDTVAHTFVYGNRGSERKCGCGDGNRLHDFRSHLPADPESESDGDAHRAV